MHKKIAIALMLTAVLATGAGCKEKTADEKGTTAETAESAEENSTDETDGDYDEQVDGEAQIQANEIDAQHEKELATESVEQTAFAQRKLYLADSDNWIRTSSENREDGSFGEEYQANESLTYSWNYAPAEKADAQTGLDMCMISNEWTLSESTYSEDITAALGCETYYYTAYEDDNGYSMLHRGIYINTETGYYTADFSMMEGDSGEYYEMAGQYLAQVSFAD